MEYNVGCMAYVIKRILDNLKFDDNENLNNNFSFLPLEASIIYNDFTIKDEDKPYKIKDIKFCLCILYSKKLISFEKKPSNGSVSGKWFITGITEKGYDEFFKLPNLN